MKERPILYSAPMVLALLAGRKTQTRRALKVQPLDVLPMEGDLAGKAWVGHMQSDPPRGTVFRSRHGVPGDRLWGRETWGWRGSGTSSRKPDVEDWFVQYRADGLKRTITLARSVPPKVPKQKPAQPIMAEPDSDAWFDAIDARNEYMSKFWKQWRPAIFMPRAFSRLLHEVTDIRCQRLQDISEEDAIAEGAFFTDHGRRCHHDWTGPGPCPAPPEHHPQKEGWAMEATTDSDHCLGTARMAYANLWNRINGPEAWDSNPWVWAVSFKPVTA